MEERTKTVVVAVRKLKPSSKVPGPFSVQVLDRSLIPEIRLPCLINLQKASQSEIYNKQIEELEKETRSCDSRSIHVV